MWNQNSKQEEREREKKNWQTHSIYTVKQTRHHIIKTDVWIQLKHHWSVVPLSNPYIFPHPPPPPRNLKTKQIDLTWPQFYRQLLESALYIPLSRSLSYLYETQYLRFQPLDGILIFSFLLATSSQPVSLSVLFVLFFFSVPAVNTPNNLDEKKIHQKI